MQIGRGFPRLFQYIALADSRGQKFPPTAPPDPSSGFAAECFWFPQNPTEQIWSRFESTVAQ